MRPVESIVYDEIKEPEESSKQEYATSKQAKRLFHELEELSKIVRNERVIHRKLECRVELLEKRNQEKFVPSEEKQKLVNYLQCCNVPVDCMAEFVNLVSKMRRYYEQN